VAAVITLVALLLAVLVTYVYTFVLFEYAGQVSDILLGAMPFAVYLLMILAITLMWSSIAKSTAIAAVLSLASFFATAFLGVVPWVRDFNPGTLSANGVTLTAGGTYERMLIHIAIAVGITILCLFVSTQVLKKREG